MTKFSTLQNGDIFEAYGKLFQKMPKVMTGDSSYRNATNLTTRQLVFFGPTVPVDYVEHSDLKNWMLAKMTLTT